MDEQREISFSEKIDTLSDRARLWFAVSVGVFVLVISFFYGFARGLSKNATLAHARASLSSSSFDSLTLPDGIQLPSGTFALPMGKNVRINDKNVDIATFLSNRPIPALVQDQLDLWRQKDLQLVHRVSEKRAVIVGTDRSTGQKYSLMIWMVPPMLRQTAAQGYAVQGTIAISDKEKTGARTDMRFVGEVPGVPVMPGGQGGAVFSSDDVGGRSHTSVYTIPGTIRDGLLYYRNELSQSGWTEIENRSDLPFGGDYAQQRFTRGEKEITLLYSSAQIDQLKDENTQTLITVILSGRMPNV